MGKDEYGHTISSSSERGLEGKGLPKIFDKQKGSLFLKNKNFHWNNEMNQMLKLQDTKQSDAKQN